MVSTCSLIAFIRNEIKLFWTGNFYNEILLDLFKMNWIKNQSN